MKHESGSSLTPDQADALRKLPSITALLEEESVKAWRLEVSHHDTVWALRNAIGLARETILRNGAGAPRFDAAALVETARKLLGERDLPSLRRVINATGVVLHTNLGRAPLCESAVDAVAEVAGGYCNLEYDLASGKRGKRVSHVAAILCELTGAEAATVVNNNAAATLLILRALCRDGEVIVSRGQLVEIGGSFRLPDVMVESGAILREVGSTNRTRISDYDAAIGENSAALLRVHTSNYRIVGFAREASLEELVSLGRERGLLVIDDVGSGAMFDVSAIGCGREPVVRESIEAGADLVCFSGDKLLGGPQAGIVVGRWELVARMERHPLMRAVRADKMTLAALGATLRHYRDVEGAMACVPVVGMLAAPLNVVSDRAARLQWLLSDGVEGEEFHVASDVSYAGGGSLPGEGLETVVVRWRPSGIGAEEAARRLRLGSPPVVARVNEGAVVFDVRTIGDDDLEAVARLVASVLDDISLEND